MARKMFVAVSDDYTATRLTSYKAIVDYARSHNYTLQNGQPVTRMYLTERLGKGLPVYLYDPEDAGDWREKVSELS